MSTYPFMQVDAFTDRALGGNPCAVVFDADDLDDHLRLRIAREMNLSETAFVERARSADVGARYFTPNREIPLAGHPTIATVFALFESGRRSLDGALTRISLELKAGIIDVEVHARDGRPGRVVMSQMRPAFMARYEARDLLPVFGLSAEDAMPGLTPQTVSTGTPQLMIPVASHDALRRVRIDADAYAALAAGGDFFSPHVFALGGVTEAGATFARHVGALPGGAEDPFTGSATGGMAAYLWHYGVIDTPAFVAEQGHWMGRPGKAFVEVVGPRDAIETVKVGGEAVTVVRGELDLGRVGRG
ncbi:MAG: PhzF family phenazine biosynthesis isomerase [Gammaproteobacteria bacterium]|nr:PhzF family phenazine biosynthesis isomerase [Gammaproteobacteria bacterium]NIM73520.1 PhzF family phenazine biosynthesis isomerase [Gammaproteobacteria bacterium]NIN39929.1 PhzF family phenazine biosynthesis isomerase [Gammaproteobacteria bacterium]NIO25329.1 PhzF family phenazine biosynthesis isomerase [Gammaproteobacteria bacterium]NIO65956.1 PhzF family phenazine biosynthesis isomerase [Gammaproteobacteria bacterium]